MCSCSGEEIHNKISKDKLSNLLAKVSINIKQNCQGNDPNPLDLVPKYTALDSITMGAEMSKKVDQEKALKQFPEIIPPEKVHSSGSMPKSPSVETVDIETDESNEYLSIDSHYDFVKILGHGSSAQVHMVEHSVTGQQYACKVVDKNGRINDDKSMATEVEIMKRIRHRNVTTMHELFDTKDRKQMVLDLAAAGSLLEVLAMDSTYNEDRVASYFRQVFQGLSYLHSVGVVHRDLRLDNILCAIDTEDENRDLTVKIADFGLSALIPLNVDGYVPKDRQSLKKFKSLTEVWGTANYFSPEVRKKAYGPQADVWALGCVLFELLTGDVAFAGQQAKMSLLDRIILNGGKKIKKAFELNPRYQKLTPEVQDLIRGMLQVNPRKRYDAKECLDHPWITGRNTPLKSKYLDIAHRVNKNRALHKRQRHRDFIKELYVSQQEELKRQEKLEQTLSPPIPVSA